MATTTEAAAQQQSLTTGEDTRKTKRQKLTAKASQPNTKREGGHLWSNLVVIAFCVAGLVLTLKDPPRVRGDQHMFMVAFSVAIGISGAETLLNIVLIIVSSRKSDDEEGGCCKKCGTACLAILINLIYLVGCCVSFALLVVSLVSSKDEPCSEVYGCANGFGCANIMAIIACIIYGLRVLAIAICLPCIICAGCCACCACLFCCARSEETTRAIDGGESGQQQPQNSSL